MGTERLSDVRRKDPLLGTRLGDYRVLEPLGEGAMGLVYRGVHPVLGRPVAIKVMREGLSGDPAFARRMLEEARAVAAIRHPNVIDVFGFGKTPAGQSYFVMELLDGEPLDAYLKREGGGLPLEEAVELLAQTAAALAAAHGAGVIHRDLKPANIFVVRLGDDTSFIKVLDFGVAKRGAPGEVVRPTGNSLVGTPLYMPPEQAAATELGPYTDLYALGCIAYELLTGHPPFDGESLWVLLEKHRAAPVPPIDREGVPPALERLVMELLEKEPARRPASAGGVRRALERIGEQLAEAPTRTTGLKAMPDARPTRIRRPPVTLKADTERVAPKPSGVMRSLVFGGAGALAAVLLIGLGVVIGRQRQPEAAPVSPAVIAPRPAPPDDKERVEPPKVAEPVAAKAPARPHPKERAADEDDPFAIERRVKGLKNRLSRAPEDASTRALNKQLDDLIGCHGPTCMGMIDELEKRMPVEDKP